MSQYLAAYDVTNDRQRTRVARVLDRYGERIQRSVFVLWIQPDDLPELRREVGSLLQKDDRFDLFPVDERGTRRRISWQRPQVNNAAVIVVDDEVNGEW
ncbi:MAG TPA: CRISPR-associated endonuclease Cas2 [Planctomycetaceae bacterium]|nr:CRISPR-associated endonuclease Cas2 [Planctomycetaceae bacterium]